MTSELVTHTLHATPIRPLAATFIKGCGHELTRATQAVSQCDRRAQGKGVPTR